MRSHSPREPRCPPFARAPRGPRRRPTSRLWGVAAASASRSARSWRWALGRPSHAGGCGWPVQAHQEVAWSTSAVGQLDGRAHVLEAGQRRAGPGHRERCTQRGPAGQGRVGHQLFDGDRSGQGQMPTHARRGRLVVLAQCGGQGGVPVATQHPSCTAGSSVGHQRVERARSRPAPARAATSESRRSCNLVGVARHGARPGRARRPPPRARSAASSFAGTGRPSGPRAPRPRRRASALVRRSSSGASSRKV